MKCKLEKREWLYAGLFALLFAYLCWRLYPILFAVHDDMLMYTITREGHILTTALKAAQTGRIAQLWDYPLLCVPYLADSVPVYKAISYACTLFDFGALFVLLDRHVSRDAAWLSVISCAAFATISDHHNVLIAYALSHQLPAGLCLLALHFFLQFLETRRKRDMAACCALYLAGSLLYEACLPYLLAFLAASVWNASRHEGKFLHFCKDALLPVLPPLGCAAGYTAVYLVWQHFYPPSYQGISLDVYEPFYSLRILWEYSIAMLPSRASSSMDYAIDMAALLRSISIVPAVKAVLMTVVFLMMMRRMGQNRQSCGMLLVLTAAAIAPNMLIAFSEKYTEHAKLDVTEYIPSFYSYLVLIAALCMAFAMLYRRLGHRHLQTLFTVFIGVVVCLSSLLSDYNIGFWQAHYAVLDQRYRNFDHAVSSPAVTQCDSTWEIFAPDNGGIHYHEPYTLRYLALYDPSPAGAYVLEENAIDWSRPVLCLRSDEDYQLMTAAVADKGLCADELTVLTTLPGTFDVSLRLTSGNTLTFADIADGETVRAPAGARFDLHEQVHILSS